MTPETKLDLAAIKERAAAATPGPWRIGRLVECAEDFVFIAHARTDVPALVAEVERLREWKETHSVSSTLRTRAETAEARVAELEAAARDTLREADLRHALEDADRDCLGCGAKLMHGEVHRDGCAIGRLRTLLAKGGAA